MASLTLEQLIDQLEIVEATLRTQYMQMGIAAEQMSCMATSMRHAKEGQNSYKMLKVIQKKIEELNNLHNELTQTIILKGGSDCMAGIKINNPTQEDKTALLKKKLTILKTLLHEKKIDRAGYDTAVRKVKREFYNITLVE